MRIYHVFILIFFIIYIFAIISIAVYADDFENGKDEYGGNLYPDNTGPTGEANPYYINDFNKDITEPASSSVEELSQDKTESTSSPVEEFSQDQMEPTSSPVEEFIKDKMEPVKIIQEPVIVDTVAPITPSNTTGFQKVIMGLLGNYSPVVIEYAYTNTNGYISYIREVQPDYSWMCGAAIFLVVLYSLFRLIGVLIKR